MSSSTRRVCGFLGNNIGDSGDFLGDNIGDTKNSNWSTIKF